MATLSFVDDAGVHVTAKYKNDVWNVGVWIANSPCPDNYDAKFFRKFDTANQLISWMAEYCFLVH